MIYWKSVNSWNICNDSLEEDGLWKLDGGWRCCAILKLEGTEFCLVPDIQKGNSYTLSHPRCGYWKVATGSLESPDYNTLLCVNSIGLYKQIHFGVISWNGLNNRLMSGRSSLRYNSTYEDNVQEGFHIQKNQAIVSLPTWLGFQYVHINQKPCRIF